ncbi:MAG: leucine-rich repeat domain-containing protein [Paludibacter sp.]|nr:leucine-rich repeat domain-containing protein [Paludibacter sp.]
MKANSFFFFSFILCLTAQAQVSKTVNVTNAGTLGTLLTVNEKNTITNLNLTGNIDARDVKCLRDEIRLLAVLDISSVQIQYYKGTLGTISNDTIYQANEMPQYSFSNKITYTSKESLKSITLPNTITSVGSNAFRSCYNLTNTLIPGSVISIGNSAFASCGKMAELKIPGSVTSIGDNAFSGCYGLTSINIENGVISIGSNAFDNCVDLTSITIPKSVISIGSNAFRFSRSLTKILVDADNSNYSSVGGVLFNKNQTTLIYYPYNQPLSYYTIPGTVTSIGNNAFEMCSGLTSITIPNTVKSIGDYAFSWSGLTSVTIPNSVTSIADNTFLNCNSLTSLTMRSGVTSIGVYSFGGCSGLTGNLVIPNTITSIDENAFFLCTGITGITLPNSVTSIGDGAFGGCSGLTEITIPNSIISIGARVFERCSGLTKITIPNSVTKIGVAAFQECTAINNVNIPSSVTSIGASAFQNCFSLTSVSIPSSVTSIGSSAFACYPPIATVISKSSDTSSKQNSIKNQKSSVDYGYFVSKLSSIYAYSATPVDLTASSCVFSGVNKTCTVYVPKGSKAAYKSANQWKDFINIIETPIPLKIEFAPIGAKWHYSQTGIIDLDTYKTIESVGDTIIEGKTCRKLVETSRNGFAPIRAIRIMYSKNDSISEYYNSSFHLLYDFGAVKGDTITIGVNLPKMIIDSTSTISINGSVRKVQYVTCSDGKMFEFGGKVIEGIGNSIFMFPTYDMNYDGPLRCYEDSIIGTYINPVWGSIDCEKITTGILKNPDREVSVYMNNQSKNIVVKGIQNTASYELIDIQGRKIKSGELNENCSIEAEVLKPGIYLLKLRNPEMKVVRKLIVN